MIRTELLLALFFVILSLIAFAPLFLVNLGQFEGTVLQKIESLLSERQEILIALGTLFLVVGLSVWGGHLSNRSAEKRDTANRVLQAELKVADFRQAWIGELRNELEEFYQIAFLAPESRNNPRLSSLMAKVRMRLNMSEEAALNLYLAMLAAVKDDHENTDDEVEALLLVSAQANVFLRGEWSRMKADIRNALTFEDRNP